MCKQYCVMSALSLWACHVRSHSRLRVASFIFFSGQAKLKQLISQAFALISTSNAITSIQLTDASSQSTTRVHMVSSFETLLTVHPAVLSYQLAAAMRLIVEGSTDTKHFFDYELQFKECHMEGFHW